MRMNSFLFLLLSADLPSKLTSTNIPISCHRMCVCMCMCTLVHAYVIIHVNINSIEENSQHSNVDSFVVLIIHTLFSSTGMDYDELNLFRFLYSFGISALK